MRLQISLSQIKILPKNKLGDIWLAYFYRIMVTMHSISSLHTRTHTNTHTHTHTHTYILEIIYSQLIGNGVATTFFI